MAPGKKRDFDYFGEMEKLSALAVKQAELFVGAMENWTCADDLKPLLDKAHEIENAGDEINHSIYKAASEAFITPIEREDILALCRTLDEVNDLIEEVLINFYMYDTHVMAKGALEFAQIILKSCEAIDTSMKDFSNFKKKKFRKHIMAVNDCEEEGDRLYMKCMRNLFTQENDNAMHVMVWSRLFLEMENCCDACEHVADTMDMVLLRNS